VPTLECAQPGQELADVERFGQVVLCPRVKAVDPVGSGASGRQDQGRRTDAFGTQLGQEVEALDGRQPAIKDDHGERPRQAEVQAALAIGRVRRSPPR
jgi:hypothetical protein